MSGRPGYPLGAISPTQGPGRCEVGGGCIGGHRQLASRREAQGWGGEWAGGAGAWVFRVSPLLADLPHSRRPRDVTWPRGWVWFLVPRSSSRGSTLPKRSGRSVEPGLAPPAREGGASGGAGALQLPGEEGDRSQDVWQWMLESERQSKPKAPR